MRIFTSIIVSFLFLTLNAQFVNSDFPRGVYKMGELTSESELKFVFDSNDKICIYMNIMDKQLFVRGNYTLQNDTVLLSFLPVYIEGSYNNSLSGKTQILFEDSFGFGADISCNVYKNSDTIPIASDRFLSTIDWMPADTMRIVMVDSRENKADLYYIIPEDVNDLVITKNMDLYSLKEELRVAKGAESANELLLLDKKGESDGSIFYLGPITKETFPITNKGKEIEPVSKNYDVKEFKSSYYRDESSNNIKVYSNYDEALKVAKEEYKLLRIYNKNDMDTTAISESLMYTSLPVNDIFVCLKNDSDSINNIKSELIIMSPQEDILYTDTISYGGWGVDERGGSSDNMRKYIIDYNKILDGKISTENLNKLNFMRQYFANSMSLGEISYGSREDTLNTKKYLIEYINKYNKYSPDSLVLNTCIQVVMDDLYSSQADSIKWEKLPEYLRYLLVNKDMKETRKSLENSRYWNQDMPLKMLFMALTYKRDLPFSIIKEVEISLPLYSDYLYSLYLSSGMKNMSKDDIIQVKKYFAPIVKEIKPISKSSNLQLHSAMEVVNDRAKKMFEKDPVKLLYPFGENFEDVYEISSFYIDMYSTMFNNLAWKGYTTKDFKNIDDYMKYSEISLDLDPDNHFSYDTYAHLLYMKGDRDKAIKMEKKALELVTLVTEKNSVESRLYKLKLKAMELGTLEDYNTPEWNMEQD